MMKMKNHKKTKLKRAVNLEGLGKEMEEMGFKVKPKKPYKDMTKKELLKEITLLEKLLELNMQDLWEIAEQRDKYYEQLSNKKD